MYRRIYPNIEDIIRRMPHLEVSVSEIEYLKNKLRETGILTGLNKYLKKNYGEYNINNFDDFINKYKKLIRGDSRFSDFEDFIIETQVTGSIAGYVEWYLTKHPEALKND